MKCIKLSNSNKEMVTALKSEMLGSSVALLSSPNESKASVNEMVRLTYDFLVDSLHGMINLNNNRAHHSPSYHTLYVTALDRLNSEEMQESIVALSMYSADYKECKKIMADMITITIALTKYPVYSD
jgi:hypothetical protein